jgi:hypothetical protein
MIYSSFQPISSFPSKLVFSACQRSFLSWICYPTRHRYYYCYQHYCYYSRRRKLLICGDGDLSYSAWLVQQQQQERQQERQYQHNETEQYDITATVLESHEEHRSGKESFVFVKRWVVFS